MSTHVRSSISVIINQIIVYLKSHASTLSMSEIEIWIREDPEEVLQTPYVNGKGAAYLLPVDDNTSVYEFNKVCTMFSFQL